MGSPLCSVEHTMAAVQREELIQLRRGLHMVAFLFFPVQSPAYLPSLPTKKKFKKFLKAPKNQHKPKALIEARGLSRGCKFQLQPGRAAADVCELAGYLAKSW